MASVSWAHSAGGSNRLLLIMFLFCPIPFVAYFGYVTILGIKTVSLTHCRTEHIEMFRDHTLQCILYKTTSDSMTETPRIQWGPPQQCRGLSWRHFYLYNLFCKAILKRLWLFDKRGGESVSFLSPRLSVQSNISRKNIFVPWGLSFLSNILFKKNLKACNKVWQVVITKCDSLIASRNRISTFCEDSAIPLNDYYTL